MVNKMRDRDLQIYR